MRADGKDAVLMKSEKRAEERKTFTATIEYSYESFANGRLNRKTATGLTTNISTGGMGFYVYRPIESGQRLTVYGRQISEYPLEGKVKWCLKLSESLYRAGIRFS